MARCRSCDAEVIWVRMQGTGKFNPLDKAKRADGNVRITGRVRGTLQARVVKPGEGEYVSHFATCANAASHRRKDGDETD